MRSRGIVAEMSAMSSGRLARFTSFTVSIAGMPRMAAPRRAGFGDDAIDLLGGDKGAHGVVHQHDFGGGIDLRESVGDGLLARVAAVDDARRDGRGRLWRRCLARNTTSSARVEMKKSVMAGQAARRRSVKMMSGTPSSSRNCLGMIGAHAGAETGGGNDGCDSGHEGDTV